MHQANTKQADAPDSLLMRQPNLTAALNLCINASGLDDKAIYLQLHVDPAHWTRIRHGNAHFPIDKLEQLQDLCGNETPLRWQAMRRGYRLVPLEDAKDAKIKTLEQEAAELRKEIETLTKYGVIRKPV